MADLGTDGFDETADLRKDDDGNAVANAMGQEHDASVFGTERLKSPSVITANSTFNSTIHSCISD